MQYKKFKTVEKGISLIGYGAMRLPEKENGEVDEEKSIKLIRYAIDGGINYLDTAYAYHGGKSETIIGKALKDGYRDKVIIADKFPIWLIKSQNDLNRIFDEQMARLEVDCIDMYLLHNIIPGNWRKALEYNVIDYIDQQKKAGRIGHIGFSFHGDFNLFKEVIDSYPWEFCQIQLNFLDKNEQATLKGLEYARERGIDVVVMEPLKGGRISEKVPPSVQKIWEKAKKIGTSNEDRSPAEWAFRWVASQPGVSLVLSGMNSFGQIDENIAIFSKNDISDMSENEMMVMDEVAAEYNRKIKHQCTGCEYCVPCPQKIDIPSIINYLNHWIAFGQNPSTKFEYSEWLSAHASDCIHCKECESKCPQSLLISDIMTEAKGQFGF